MDVIIEIIYLSLPVLIIAATLIYLFHEYLRFVKSKAPAARTPESPRPVVVQNTQSQDEFLLKLRFQAAERFVLYLERISPGRLVMRFLHGKMNARTLHSELLKNIRDEFDHNLSQQIYISETAWKLIQNAKEDMIKLVNLSAESVGEDATALDLGKKIFESAAKQKTSYTDLAIKAIREELKRYSAAGL